MERAQRREALEKRGKKGIELPPSLAQPTAAITLSMGVEGGLADGSMKRLRAIEDQAKMARVTHLNASMQSANSYPIATHLFCFPTFFLQEESRRRLRMLQKDLVLPASSTKMAWVSTAS